jgi:enamine deaminase RidA (YjgF/YER057c/UK114 family)
MDAEMLSADGATLPAEIQVFQKLQEVKSQANTYIMMKQIASSLIATTDETLAENLHDLCETAGVSFESLMKEVQETSLNVKSAISFDDNSSIAHAKQFLMEIFKNEVEIRSNDIYEAGEKRGLSKVTIRDAKTDLGIMAIRRAKGWVWTLPSYLNIPSSVEVKHGK